MRTGKPHGKVNLKWTPDFAYAIGLITSDGNLSPDGRHINFTTKDLQLAKIFRRCLGINNVIGRKMGGYPGSSEKKYCVVQFGDVLFYKFLLDIGLTPRKSKTILGLRIPSKYFFDFLRGHFDGDGCIYSYFDPRWKNSFMYYMTFTSASRPHVEWIQSTLKQLIGVSGAIGSSGQVFQLRFAKQESLALIKNMYYGINVPCLQRKRAKIIRILKTSPGGEIGKLACLRGMWS